jgi:hypothetical protein
MGFNQMTMVILAFMLLGMISVNLRRAVMDSYETMNTNTMDQSATLIARSIVDEINAKKYDEANVSHTVVRLADLSLSLGPESGETYANFDDVDDYNGAHFESPSVGTPGDASTPEVLWGTEGYVVDISVSYVDFDNPSQTSVSRTWCKLVRVTVTNSFTSDSVVGSVVKTY